MSENKAASSGKNVRGGYTPASQPANPRPPAGGTGESSSSKKK